MWKFLTLELCKKFQMKCDGKYHFTANQLEYNRLLIKTCGP